jgi:hypothetical protein
MPLSTCIEGALRSAAPSPVLSPPKGRELEGVPQIVLFILIFFLAAQRDKQRIDRESSMILRSNKGAEY